MPRDDDRLLETLKDVMYEHSLSRVEVGYHTGPDTWRTITVREPTMVDEDSPDGYHVEIQDGGL